MNKVFYFRSHNKNKLSYPKSHSKNKSLFRIGYKDNLIPCNIGFVFFHITPTSSITLVICLNIITSRGFEKYQYSSFIGKYTRKILSYIVYHLILVSQSFQFIYRSHTF